MSKALECGRLGWISSQAVSMMSMLYEYTAGSPPVR